MSILDFDREVDVAWTAFEHRLAASLTDLVKDETLRIVAPAGHSGSPASVSFVKRVTTIKIIANDGGVAGSVRDAHWQSLPRGRQFKVGAEALAADWAVGHVRDSYGVLHPSFLRIDLVAPYGRGVDVELVDDEGLVDMTVSRVVEDRRRGSIQYRARREPPVVAPIVPRTPDELDDLVEHVLMTIVEPPIVRETDGDIPIVGEGGVVFVRVRRDKPVVEVFAPLQHVTDPVAAAVEANIRNARAILATYVVCHDQLIVKSALWCHPFIGSLLVEVVEAIMKVQAKERPSA